MARVKTGRSLKSGIDPKTRKPRMPRKGSAAAARAEKLIEDGKTPGIAGRQSRARELILGELRKARSISGACEEADVAKSTFRKWRMEDPDFEAEVIDALETGRHALEDEAIRRGKNGYRKAVYHQGEVVGYERRYSDRMLEVMLEANDPGKFRKNSTVEIKGQMTHTVTTLTREELEKQLAERGLPTSIFDK